MPLATFTTESAEADAYRFPLVQQRHRIRLLKTLLQLVSLEPGTPLLIEEQYLQERDGLNLLLRLRLEPRLPVSRSPVFVRLRGSVERHLRHHPKYAVLCSRGVTLLREGEDPSADALAAAKPVSQAEQLDLLGSLVVRPPNAQSRHDLANEWGPHRLWRGYAQLTGTTEEPEWEQESFLRLRQQEYYAYLLGLAALRSTRNTETSDVNALKEYEAFLDSYQGPTLRVLLLDDEIAKGWGEAVRAVLERDGVLTVDTSLAGVDFDAHRSRVTAKINEGWDLVLADLRTSARDRAGTPSRGALQYAGAEWIRDIKSSHPETAVVAFTASNKAWSVQELRELGIDGYWVKESPEFGVDNTYSAANAARLLTMVRKALEPRIEAKSVWQLRADVDRLADVAAYKDGWVPPHKGGIGKLEVQGRIVAIRERLDRAYGFLTMNLSKHEEAAFGLRRMDLAFLTLWSILNEVDGLYFEGPKSERRGDELASHDDAVFHWRNVWVASPTGSRRSSDWKAYWRIKAGRIEQEPSAVPSKVGGEDIRKYVCPMRKGGPDWPGIGADTRRALWLLHAAGAQSLVNRFKSLRHLRNKLEEEHGKTGDRKEASLQDVHDMCKIWRTLLVTPYDHL